MHFSRAVPQARFLTTTNGARRGRSSWAAKAPSPAPSPASRAWARAASRRYSFVNGSTGGGGGASGAGAVVSSPGKQGTVRFCRRRLRFLLCRGGGIGKRVWSESRGMVVVAWREARVKA